MMELRRLTLVNWHLFDVEDIEVHGNFGILGENRSGKSTILDMAQVVLTGASKTYLRLNAVAGEGAKGRAASKRSVHSYCLGALGDGAFRRPDALTYVALGFEDTVGGGPPITIGLAIEARSSETAETVLGRFIVVGKLLTTNDLTERRSDGRYPMPWDDAKAAMIEAVGPANVFNHRDKAIDYVREYMRRLVPSLPSAEQHASALLKAIVNAMSLNQGYSATEFVRRFILEENPIRIGDLRTSIETYRSVNRTIVTLREKLEALHELRGYVGQFEDSQNKKALEEWLHYRARWLASRATNRAHLEEIASAQRFLAAEEDDREIALEGIREAKREVEKLINAIAAHAAQSGRAQWEATRARSASSAEMIGAELRRRRQATSDLALIAGVFGDGGLIRIYCNLLGVETSDARGMSDAEAALRSRSAEILGRVEQRRRTVGSELVTLQRELTELGQALTPSADRNSAAYLTSDTKHLMRRLESAGMDARPLCDIVEISDSSWIPAAEALLGRDREAVFVERSRIHDATILFRLHRREFPRASLVSLNKLEQFRASPPPATFPSLFCADDPDAMAFLQRRYGSVRLASTMEAFNSPGRALMQDGLYDDGLVRSHRHVDPRDHKIGRSAQAAMLQNMRDAYAEKGERFSTLQTEDKRLGKAHAALESFSRPDIETFAALISQRNECAAERAEAESRIAAIDASGDGGLKEKLKAQRKFQELKEAELASIEKRTNQYTIAIAVAQRSLGGNDSVEGSRQHLALAIRRYRAQRKLFVYWQGSPIYRERLVILRRPAPDLIEDRAKAMHAEAAAHRKLEQKAVDGVQREADRNRRAELGARAALRDYFNNPNFGVSAQVGPDSSLLNDVKPWMDLLIEDIEGNELRRFEEKAREASERASVLFRGEFVNALNSRVSKLERDIESLNRSLKDHPFHNERYSFHRTAEAEFLPILKIIEISRISDEALDMLFKFDVPEDFPHKDTIKAVEQLLEDPDKDFSAFEDYRNFYAFEIHMEDVQSGARTRWETRRSTGSGAEQQVPLYVAIGASLAAVYGAADGSRGPKGMSPALFDEAFSKMDGKNQRAMMSFYADLGLQVVIAAPLEKKAAIMGYMETLVEIDRIRDHSSADVVRIGKRARDELLAMNPEHLSEEEIVKRMAAE